MAICGAESLWEKVKKKTLLLLLLLLQKIACLVHC